MSGGVISGRAIDEIEAKQAAAFLIREGATPRGVARLTGTSLHFAQRLAREFGRDVRRERGREGGREGPPGRNQDPVSRLWSSRVRALETSLFGLCLERLCLERLYRERSGRAPGRFGEPGLVVGSYRLFRMLCRPTIGRPRAFFSAHEAVLFYGAYVEGRVELVRCRSCRAGVWIMRDAERHSCPNCRCSILHSSLSGAG